MTEITQSLSKTRRWAPKLAAATAIAAVLMLGTVATSSPAAAWDHWGHGGWGWHGGWHGGWGGWHGGWGHGWGWRGGGGWGWGHAGWGWRGGWGWGHPWWGVGIGGPGFGVVIR